SWGFWQELGMIAKSAMPEAEQRAIADDIRRRGWTAAGIEAFDAILRRCDATEVLVWPHALPAVHTRPPAHPLLADRAAGDGYVSYGIRLDGDMRWIIDEHRVGAMRVLPGTAYLEIVRA